MTAAIVTAAIVRFACVLITLCGLGLLALAAARNRWQGDQTMPRQYSVAPAMPTPVLQTTIAVRGVRMERVLAALARRRADGAFGTDYRLGRFLNDALDEAIAADDEKYGNVAGAE